MKFLFALLFCQVALAKIEIPILTGPVVDQASILTTGEKDQLTQLVLKTHRQGGPHIQTLTIESLEGEPIEDYSMRVLNEWSIKDNGIIILISKNDRKIRLEVGHGIEKQITGPQGDDYISKIMVPSFQKGEFYNGISLVIEDISKKFGISLSPSGNQGKMLQLKPTDFSQRGFIPLILLALIILRQIFMRFIGNNLVSKGIFGIIFGSGLGYFSFGPAFPIIAVFGLAGLFLSIIGILNSFYYVSGGRAYPKKINEHIGHSSLGGW